MKECVMDLKYLKRWFGLGHNYQFLLAVGQISLLGMILLSRLELQVGIADFFEGMLTGLSIATNLAGITLYARSQTDKGNDDG
jgi:hypothetical protein